MPRVSLAFFFVAAVCGLTGMIWGSYMGNHEDFTMAHAHAHLNLLGWVTPALMGTFYALAGAARPKALSWINFVLSVLGVIVFIPGLIMVLSNTPGAAPYLAIGSLGVMLGMLSFIVAIVFVFLKKQATPA
ncbi:MAG: hypothetical protein ABUS48_04320 [Pseudomonadota bacterium]